MSLTLICFSYVLFLDGARSIVDIEADGNCLFRSISDQLYHDFGNNHAEIRDEICNFMEGHKDEFSLFLVLDDEDAKDEEDAADFEEYIQNMRKDGEWGGNLELVAAARMYRRNITVYSANLSAFTIEHGSDKQSAGPDLMVTFHDNDHYNSVRLNNGSKPPPPIKTFQQLENLSSKNLNCFSGPVDMVVDEIAPDTIRPDGSTLVTTAETMSTSVRSSPVCEPSKTAQEEEKSLKLLKIKKGADCPCGSGLRYRKCCLNADKQRAKNSRRKAHNNNGIIDDPIDDSKVPTEMNGDFRVLKI
jgi:OTU domain-containing protein 3